MLTVGSLFAGIGGFDLGLERAGMRTVWFCEQDPYCQRVLAKHWPGVPCYLDVRSLVADAIGTGTGLETHNGAGQTRGYAGPCASAFLRQRDGASGSEGHHASGGDGYLPVPVPYVDILCGGFPCQDLSYAGKGAGLDGERSGLWSEYARLIRELRPRYVIVENVPALLARGFGRVLGDLAACGYDAEWDCIPASAVGAPHRRDRVWLVAYPSSVDGERAQRSGGSGWRPEEQAGDGRNRSRTLGNSDGLVGSQAIAGNGGPGTLAQPEPVERTIGSGGGFWDQWSVEPDVGRVAHGIPNRVDRLRSLGNALVPQIAEWIGRRIVEYESQHTHEAGVA